MNLDDLIARLEAAEGPDRLLDCDIHDALGFSKYRKPLAYTAFLDAAMTLVPEGWLEIEGWDTPSKSYRKIEVEYPGMMLSYEGRAATPALALCAAALRARKEN